MLALPSFKAFPSGVIAVVLLCGCGGGGDLPTLVRISGRVTLDGNPVDGATVTFHSLEAGGRPARGETGADGGFVLKTYVDSENDLTGAMPGSYEVTVRKQKHPYDDLSEEERSAKIEADMQAGRTAELVNLLPAKYAKRDSSTIEFTVEQAKDDVVLDLVTP